LSGTGLLVARRELIDTAERLAVESDDPPIASGFSIAGMYLHDYRRGQAPLNDDEWATD
jgi:hypothetical protein